MANRSSYKKNVKPIRESILLLRLAVDQLCAMMEGGALPNELELARTPNLRRSTLLTSLTYLENEETIFHQWGVTHSYLIKQTRMTTLIFTGGKTSYPIEVTDAFQGINVYIERFHSFQKAIQSIYHYFAQELNLTIGFVTSWLRTMVADI